MADEIEELRSLLARTAELEAELRRVQAQLIPTVLSRMAKGAETLRVFDAPSPRRVGGVMLHAARCVDVVGARLRDAIGATMLPFAAGEDDGNPPPTPLLLRLDREPGPADFETLAGLGLQPVFKPGRWKACNLWSGEAAPERLVPLVLAHGGDVCALRRSKRRTEVDGGG